jgi:glycine/D-amino acid oxidase-like deaminating enzyme
MARNPQAIIIGAGIAGAAAAYFLTVRHGFRDVVLVEEGDPLSLTSDKSSECYRNWWPGPGTTMVDFSNRSIDLLEELSLASDERFNMSRRGYAFASADERSIETFRERAATAAMLGSGEAREHHGNADDPPYVPHNARGWQGMPTGTDLLLDQALIQSHFPDLHPNTKAVLHVRRCGWISAHQLGTYFLEQAREHGATILRAKASAIGQADGQVKSVTVDCGDGPEVLETDTVVLSPGPGLGLTLAMLDVDLPIAYECHVKISLADTREAMNPDAPMLLWEDPVTLPWTDEERKILSAEDETRYLTLPFPSGVHVRPEGARGNTHLLALWTYHIEDSEPTFPITWDPHLPEIIVRGMSAMMPAMERYFDPLPRIPVDGGYYTKTPENRPLVGALPVKGAFINSAYSGFGIMSACAGGELLAAHVTGGALPSYAEALSPNRYDDPEYLPSFGDARTAGQI